MLSLSYIFELFFSSALDKTRPKCRRPGHGRPGSKHQGWEDAAALEKGLFLIKHHHSRPCGMDPGLPWPGRRQ